MPDAERWVNAASLVVAFARRELTPRLPPLPSLSVRVPRSHEHEGGAGKVPCGLKNLGNTCYLNWCVFATPQPRKPCWARLPRTVQPRLITHFA